MRDVLERYLGYTDNEKAESEGTSAGPGWSLLLVDLTLHKHTHTRATGPRVRRYCQKSWTEPTLFYTAQNLSFQKVFGTSNSA